MLLLYILLLILPQQAADIEVNDVWVRPGGKGMNTGLFLNIVNNGSKADTLLKAEAADVKRTEIHETYQKGDMMGMREVGKIGIEPGRVFNFKPGSYHIMLINLKKDLKPGQKLKVKLYFKNAGMRQIEAEVKRMKM